MKILIISTAAIPTPPPDDGYSGLERICAWLTFEFAKKGHDVTLISAKGSPWEGSHPIMDGDKGQIATMNVIGTINPTWDGNAEAKHYQAYQKLLEKEFSDGNSIVLDSTWWPHSYLSKQRFPNMNLVHVHHGMLGFVTSPPVLHPRFLGLSTYHAHLLSNVLNVPVRHIHNGIPLVQFPPDYQPSSTKGDYLLSLNRITDEKGIHDAIDVAVATKTPIVVAGDDTKVTNQKYVNQVIERCRHSNGLATYMGLVDNKTKNSLIQNCKAIISCPKPSWMEAFGLYAVEAGAYYKPVLALANGGLLDIVVNGVTGYLADNPEQLKQFVQKLDGIDPLKCRENVETRFTTEIMASNYLNTFQKILDKDETSYW